MGSRSDGLGRMAEADHRIANHLAMLASYVRLKGAELVRHRPGAESRDVALLLQAICVQINAISSLHRILSTDGTQRTAELGEHLGRICAALRSGVSGDVEIVEAFGADCVLPLRDVLPVAQIVTEIVTNALKHGCPQDAPARVLISCRREAGGTIRVEVADNGPGLPPGAGGVGRGLGARLIGALVAQVQGRVEYLAGPRGLTVRLILGAAPGQGPGGLVGAGSGPDWPRSRQDLPERPGAE